LWGGDKTRAGEGVRTRFDGLSNSESSCTVPSNNQQSSNENAVGGLTSISESSILPASFSKPSEQKKYAAGMQNLDSRFETLTGTPTTWEEGGSPRIARQIDKIDAKSLSLPPDLAELSEFWSRLPDAVKSGFLATARALAREVRP